MLCSDNLNPALIAPKLLDNSVGHCDRYISAFLGWAAPANQEWHQLGALSGQGKPLSPPKASASWQASHSWHHPRGKIGNQCRKISPTPSIHSITRPIVCRTSVWKGHRTTQETCESVWRHAKHTWGHWRWQHVLVKVTKRGQSATTLNLNKTKRTF